MRWYYGGYAFPENTLRNSARLENTHNDLGMITEQKWVWRLTGALMAQGQTQCVAAQTALQIALNQPRQNLVLRTDSGAVAMALTNTGSIGGVRCKSLAFPDGTDGFEFVSGRTFECEFEATYSVLTHTSGAQLLTFNETIETFGGGPVTGFLRPVNAEPVPVRLYSHSLYEATQTGQTTCLLGYWPVPPAALGTPIEAPRISRSYDGKTFTTNWTYRFQSTRPFVGLPTRVI